MQEEEEEKRQEEEEDVTRAKQHKIHVQDIRQDISGSGKTKTKLQNTQHTKQRIKIVITQAKEEGRGEGET